MNSKVTGSKGATRSQASGIIFVKTIILYVWSEEIQSYLPKSVFSNQVIFFILHKISSTYQVYPRTRKKRSWTISKSFGFMLMGVLRQIGSTS